MRVLVLLRYGRMAASTRQRFEQYEPYLARAGVDLVYTPLLDDAHLKRVVEGKRASPWATARAYAKRLRSLLSARGYDALWVHCEVFPFLPSIFERLAFLPGRPVVYDFDDAFYEVYDGSEKAAVRAILGGKLGPLMRGSEACCCGNRNLLAYASRHNPRCLLVPTVVDTDIYRPREERRSGERPVIGWIGSPSTFAYVRPLLPLLADVARECGARVRIVGAGTQPEAEGFPGVEFAAWSEATEVDEVRNMDVGIMPLPDDKWARGKSGYKLIQYMACAIPVIASPVGANEDIVEDGREGLLATSENEWADGLRRLLRDPDSRQRMGEAGRRRVEVHYALKVTAPQLVQLFGSLRGGET